MVGAGPAGITAACLAAARGHRVVPFERQARIGGWLRAGWVPAIRFDVANHLTHLKHRVAHAIRQHGLECRLTTDATPDLLIAGSFDAV